MVQMSVLCQRHLLGRARRNRNQYRYEMIRGDLSVCRMLLGGDGTCPYQMQDVLHWLEPLRLQA